MARHLVGNIDDLIAHQDINGNILISKTNETSLSYIGIRCSGGGSLHDLHKNFRTLILKNTDLINVISPYSFQGFTGEVLATKCLLDKNLNHLDSNWFFDYVLIHDSFTSSHLKPLFATTRFKKLIVSMLSHVEIFENQNFRPVLNLDKMFVSPDGAIIFSEYEPRGSQHNQQYEINEVIAILQALVTRWASHSDTLVFEFQELCDWVAQNLFDYRGDAIKEVFKQVVFWTPAMRIRYIIDLDTAAGSHAHDIHLHSPHAFLVAGAGATNWYLEIENSKHPILTELLIRGDRYFHYESVNPSSLRAPRGAGVTVPAWNMLVSGLKRMRDSFFHAKENCVKMGMSDRKMYTDIEFQHLFQDFFPRHMVEFAKSQHLTSFNAIGQVLMLISESFLEDVQPLLGNP